VTGLTNNSSTDADHAVRHVFMISGIRSATADLELLGIPLSWQSQAGESSLVKKDLQSSYIVPLMQIAASVLAADCKQARSDCWDMYRRGWDVLMKLQ